LRCCRAVSKTPPFTITFDALAAAANEADVDSSVIHFRVEAVSSGTLQKSGSAVLPGATLLSPGQSLVWTPAAGVYGGAVTAFTVKAYDGTLASANPVPVAVSVANVNAPPVIELPTAPGPEFVKGGAAILIDPAATVTDPDSVSFEGAVLTVAISGFASADDRLAIRNQGQISTVGSGVTHNGTSIGTFSGWGWLFTVGGAVQCRRHVEQCTAAVAESDIPECPPGRSTRRTHSAVGVGPMATEAPANPQPSRSI
jgi:hypothetical protein